jgi:NAD(P)-dependent dehydrogenase (short-subunit alcohol dehydrogenase family)
MDLQGKVAFITGGASGIGLAMAEAFGREGMSVMLADIEAGALEAAVAGLRDKQVRAEGVICNVTDRGALRAAALETVAKFGKVHVVCNNAGVGGGGPLGSVLEGDWDWVLDVNLKGVVYGVEVFTPLIESHGEGGWFVNTASIAGILSPPGMEPYCATKFAVVAMSEGWARQLEGRGIGVSILCPGFVKTHIDTSRRNRPAAYGADTRVAPANAGPSLVQTGIPPQAVGARVVEAIKDGELYIFTHPEFKAATEARFNRILAAFDKSAASPAINALPPRTAPGLNLPE